MEENNELQPDQELTIQLSFVPTWARRPPGIAAATAFSSEEERRPERRRYNDNQQERPNRRPPFKRAGPPSPTANRHPQTERRARVEEQPVQEELPINVNFSPNRVKLDEVVQQIITAQHAFPVQQLSQLFLAAPDSCLIDITVNKGATKQQPGFQLVQCQVCQALFLDKGAVIDHILSQHWENFYDQENIVVDPPNGNFNCVCRCPKSGVILGPPNYHGFNSKLAELHRERFSHLNIDDYRRSIETIRDEALVNQWKEEMCKKTIYRARNEPDTPAMSYDEAVKHFMTHHADKQIKAANRFTLPAGDARRLSDKRLIRAMRNAWLRETHRPIVFGLNLKRACRQKKLHVFQLDKHQAFITAIRPAPLTGQNMIEPIREVLSFLTDNTGCTRQKLLEGLRPGLAPESPEVATVLQQLRWLIDKGHVIEFSDGTLSIPSPAAAEPKAAVSTPDMA